MENLQNDRQPPGGAITPFRKQFGQFAQTDRRNEQERKPCAAADESGVITKKNPGNTSDRENNDGSDAPAAIRLARSPGAQQNEQRCASATKRKRRFRSTILAPR